MKILIGVSCTVHKFQMVINIYNNEYSVVLYTLSGPFYFLTKKMAKAPKVNPGQNIESRHAVCMLIMISNY